MSKTDFIQKKFKYDLLNERVVMRFNKKVCIKWIELSLHNQYTVLNSRIKILVKASRYDEQFNIYYVSSQILE